jgi:hypothetical protein
VGVGRQELLQPLRDGPAVKAEGLDLLAPYKSRKQEKEPRPRSPTQKRRRIETIIGQLWWSVTGL